MGSLIARCITFLDMPLVAGETVKRVQGRQRTKPGCSAKQLHRPRAVMAARSFGRGRVGVAHDTISSRSAGCGARALPANGQELNSWQCSRWGLGERAAQLPYLYDEAQSASCHQPAI